VSVPTSAASGERRRLAPLRAGGVLRRCARPRRTASAWRLATLPLIMVMASGPAFADRDVVSLDFCADQFVLHLLPRSRILALSPDARAGFSHLRNAAQGLPLVRPAAEDVIALDPDVVVRSYGGGHGSLEFFERSGIEVVQIPRAQDLGEVRAAVLEVAAALGVRHRGLSVVAVMDERLAAVRRAPGRASALYLTPGGATSGPGTLIHEILGAAGLSNYEQRAGWHAIPLERLAYEDPDVVVYSTFGNASEQTAWWSSMRHPVARRQLSATRAIRIAGDTTACAGWFVLDAIEELAAAMPR
jgi:iron complex transport system substrate-binding protein